MRLKLLICTLGALPLLAQQPAFKMPRMADGKPDFSGTYDWPKDPGDEEIFRVAIAESRVLVTIDKDFGELAIVQGIAHAGLIRRVGFRAAEQGLAVARLLVSYESELTSGAILTAEPWRVRVRPG